MTDIRSLKSKLSSVTESENQEVLSLEMMLVDSNAFAMEEEDKDA